MEIKIIEEKPITLAEMKRNLVDIEKRDKELNFRANKVKGYLENFGDIYIKDIEKIKKSLIELNIPRLKERHIVKVIDVMPNDIDGLKALFTGENITIKEEDMQRIHNIVKEFVK